MPAAITPARTGVERIAPVPIYATDSLVRRAPALQSTTDANPALLQVGLDLWESLGLHSGDLLQVTQGGGSAELPVTLDASLAPRTVRIPAGLPETSALGRSDQALELSRVPAAQGAAA
jgi:NADH-quinone oxidoreductase subunit G